MRKLKIGDTISFTTFSGKNISGKIDRIEIASKYLPKYGRSVSECDMDIHPYGTLELDCGRWCYFNQIKSIN